MSTRSLTSVKSRWGEGEWRTHAVIYRHSDGYLTGHGEQLFEFLNGLEVVNGIKCEGMPERWVNGPGELAAELVVHLWRLGCSPDLMDHGELEVGQEFHYEISVDYGPSGGVIRLVVYDGPMTFFGEGGKKCVCKIFEGTVSEFGQFLEDYREGRIEE